MKKHIASLALAIALAGCHNYHTHSHESNSTVAAQNNYFGAYTLVDEKYGTKTTVTIDGDKRIMVTNALPNHETGHFPRKGNPNTISAQNKRYEIPLHPVFTGEVRWARETGVALNGVKFEPETAEVVVCESGENYRVEAKQSFIDLGLDFNNAHVQPTGAYHYHGVPTGVVHAFDKGGDLVHIGFAHDGFAIYYSKSGAYKPGYRLIDETRTGTDCTYANPRGIQDVKINGEKKDGTYKSDWEYVKGLGDLDECNGREVNGQYAYFVTVEYPYVGRCLKGAFKEQRGGGPPPGRQRPPQGGRPPGPPRN